MGRLGSGPRLVGRIWSGVRVSASFQKILRRQQKGFTTYRSYEAPVTVSVDDVCDNFLAA